MYIYVIYVIYIYIYNIYIYIYVTYVIYVIMKTMSPPSYHHNGFVATHALGHMMYMSCHKAIVVITARVHCFHDNILCSSCFCEI